MGIKQQKLIFLDNKSIKTIKKETQTPQKKYLNSFLFTIHFLSN